MKCTPAWFCLVAFTAVSIALPVASARGEEWVSLFDGKSIDGWEKVGSDKSVWEVKDGALAARVRLRWSYDQGPVQEFRYRAEIKINDNGNSGLYFRTTRKPGFSDGYEAQIDSTHTDPIAPVRYTACATSTSDGRA